MTIQTAQRPVAKPSSGELQGRRLFVDILWITVVAAALSLIAITPRVVPWKDYPVYFETVKVDEMVKQLADPGGWDRSEWEDPGFNASQSIRWRLLPPVLGRLLHMSPHVYLTMATVGGLLLIALSVYYTRLRGGNRLIALAIGCLVGTSSAFFSVSTAVGYFDAYYIIALCIAAYTPSALVFIATCLVGPWIDEKFLLMLPACVMIRLAATGDVRSLWYAAVSILPYCLIRLGAAGMGESSFQRQFSMQAAVFSRYAPALPEGWWYGFRLGWIAIFVGFGAAVYRLGWKLGPVLVAGALAGIAAISFLAWDTTRSIAMVLPFLLYRPLPPLVERSLPVLAALNLVLPAAYVWCGEPVTVPLKSFLAR